MIFTVIPNKYQTCMIECVLRLINNRFLSSPRLIVPKREQKTLTSVDNPDRAGDSL